MNANATRAEKRAQITGYTGQGSQFHAYQNATRGWSKEDHRALLKKVAPATVGTAAAAIATAGSGGLAAPLLVGLGASGATSGAISAGENAADGNYGAAAKDAVGAIVSAAFPYASKSKLALNAMRYGAGALAGTDLVRAKTYYDNGMRDAGAYAANEALANALLMSPLGRFSLVQLPAIAADRAGKFYEGPAATRELDQKLDDAYGSLYDTAVDRLYARAVRRGLSEENALSAGNTVKNELQKAVSDVSTAQGKPSFLAGLFGTEAVEGTRRLQRAMGSDAVKSRINTAVDKAVDAYPPVSTQVKPNIGEAGATKSTNAVTQSSPSPSPSVTRPKQDVQPSASTDQRPRAPSTPPSRPAVTPKQAPEGRPSLGAWWANNRQWALPAGVGIAGTAAAAALIAAIIRRRRKRKKQEM